MSVLIEGERNPVTINQVVYNLSNDPKLAKPLKELVKTAEKPGITEIRSVAPERPASVITTSDARDIIASCEVVVDQTGDPETNVVTANLMPHTTVFEEGVEKWRFKYGDKDVPVDISDTTIAQDALARGTVGVDDVYRVEMEITERRTAGGQFRHDYKIRRVISFTPGQRQIDIFHSHEVISSGEPHSPPQLPKPEEEKPP